MGIFEFVCRSGGTEGGMVYFSIVRHNLLFVCLTVSLSHNKSE